MVMAKRVIADIRFPRGPKARMPQLEPGEPGLATDTEELYVGSLTGNILIGKPGEGGGGDNSGLAQRVTDVEVRVSDLAVNVKSFGAKGDGITNDSTAFQQANDFLVSKGGGTLLVPPGTFRVNFILDSNVYVEGAGVKTTILKSVSGSNKDVIQGRSFLTLTGTGTQHPETRGVRYAGISDILIDGNKQANTAGYGIRMWGCSWHWENVVVQNCVQDGIYTEFTTHDDPTGQADPSVQALESFFLNIKTLGNNGNGWTYKGPHDSSIIFLTAFSNKGWGLYQERGTLTGYLWNSWLNGHSFYFGEGISGYNIRATGPYEGTGVEFAAGAGNCTLTDCYVSGHVTGMILRGTNMRVSGTFIDNRTVDNNAGDAIVLDGPVNFNLHVNGSANHNVFKTNRWSGNNIIEGSFSIPGGKTMQAGPDDLTDYADYVNLVDLTDESNSIFNLPSRTISVAGWKPVLPQSNGTMLTDAMYPTFERRGGVYLQPDIPNVSAPPTAADFNNLLYALRYAGILEE